MKKIIVYDGYYLGDVGKVRKNENVVCYDLSGKVLWKVNGELKYWNKRSDSFVGISYRDGVLRATSFGGYVYIIDIDTGKATYEKFVK